MKQAALVSLLLVYSCVSDFVLVLFQSDENVAEEEVFSEKRFPDN